MSSAPNKNESFAKPELRIELDMPAALAAQSCLSSLMDGASYHELHDRRHPLGIYSISVGRICSKVRKCAAALEICWQHAKPPEDAAEAHDSYGPVIDYLELTLYAAAEHIDDLQIIAASFFRTNHQASKSKQVRELKQALKPLRDRVASLANAIKHAHGRIRIYSLEFSHDGNEVPIYGFFVEGFKDGAVRPHPILHGNGEAIVSITSFLWSILTYVGQASLELKRFLTAIGVVREAEVQPTGSHPFRTAAIALARLPLYSLDETHPFETVQVTISAGTNSRSELASGIYGSLERQWSDSDQHRFGRASWRYEADGATRSFKMVDPRNVSIKRWRQV